MACVIAKRIMLLYWCLFLLPLLTYSLSNINFNQKTDFLNTYADSQDTTSGSGDTESDEIEDIETIPEDEAEILERATENNGLNIQGDKTTEYVRYGDIMLTDEENRNIFGRISNQSSKKDAMADYTMYWSLQIPIEIDESLQSNIKAVNAIEAAVDEFHTKTCLNFVRRTEHKSYINLFKGEGCWSKLGKQGGKQKLSLGDGCESKATAVHELMHALGFVHEHQRSDRDNYVEIKWENIKDEKRHNFDPQNIPMTTFDQPYDYKSVMHYKGDAFGRPCLLCLSNRYKTITKKDDPEGFFSFGQPWYGGLSKIDQRQINIMYCELPRPSNLIQDQGKFGLERFLKQRLEEYDDILSPGFHELMVKTLKKVFPDYRFSFNIFTKTNSVKTSSFICVSCAYSLDKDGVSLLAGYAKKTSQFPEESDKEDLEKKIKDKIESSKVCDAVKISATIMKEVGNEQPVAMVFVTDFDDTILIKDNDAEHVMSLHIPCVGEMAGKSYIAVILFGE